MKAKNLQDLPVEVQKTLLMEIAVHAVARFDVGREARVQFHRLGENAVFRVEERKGRQFALRVHRPDYRSDTEIRSELAWLDALQSIGQPVAPAPVAGSDGDYLQLVDWVEEAGERQCDLLTWIDGIPLRRADPRQALPALGTTIALLHRHSRDWAAPLWFRRPLLDEHGLLGSTAVIGDYRNIDVTAAERALFDRAAEHITVQLTDLPKRREDFGLIHSDLLESNLLHSGEWTSVIDFDDAGIGWYAYDLSTFRCQGKALTDDPTWLDMFSSGYRRVEPLPASTVALLPVFMAARALALVGWMHSHGKFGARHRQAIIDDAVQRCSDMLISRDRTRPEYA